MVEDITLHEYDNNAMKIVVSNLKVEYPDFYVIQSTTQRLPTYTT